jgi:hypothetical protein
MVQSSYYTNKINDICQGAIDTGYVKIEDLWLVLGFEESFTHDILKDLYEKFKCAQLRGIPQWELREKNHYKQNHHPKDWEDWYHSKYGNVWKYILFRWAAISRGNEEAHIISMKAHYRLLTPYEYDDDNRAFNKIKNLRQGSQAHYIKLSELREAFKRVRLPIPKFLTARRDKKTYVSDRVKIFLEDLKKSGEVEKTYKCGVAKELKNYTPQTAKKRVLEALHHHRQEYVKRKFVQDDSLYSGVLPGKGKRTFEGKLIHKIVSETFKNERVPGDYQKLYQVYKGLK